MAEPLYTIAYQNKRTENKTAAEVLQGMFRYWSLVIAFKMKRQVTSRKAILLERLY